MILNSLPALLNRWSFAATLKTSASVDLARPRWMLGLSFSQGSVECTHITAAGWAATTIFSRSLTSPLFMSLQSWTSLRIGSPWFYWLVPTSSSGPIYCNDYVSSYCSSLRNSRVCAAPLTLRRQEPMFHRALLSVDFLATSYSCHLFGDLRFGLVCGWQELVVWFR